MLKLKRTIKRYYSLSKAGYRLDVCHGWFHLYWLNRAFCHAKKARITKWKLMANSGIRNLYLSFTRLALLRTTLQVQSKSRLKINFKFHFFIYRDLNVTVFSKRFPTINIWMKFNTVQNVRCRMYVVAYYVMFATRNESTMVKAKKKKRSCIIVLYCNAWKLSLYLFWPPRVTPNAYRYEYVYHLPLNFYSRITTSLVRAPVQ